MPCLAPPPGAPRPYPSTCRPRTQLTPAPCRLPPTRRSPYPGVNHRTAHPANSPTLQLPDKSKSRQSDKLASWHQPAPPPATGGAPLPSASSPPPPALAASCSSHVLLPRGKRKNHPPELTRAPAGAWPVLSRTLAPASTIDPRVNQTPLLTSATQPRPARSRARLLRARRYRNAAKRPTPPPHQPPVFRRTRRPPVRAPLPVHRASCRSPATRYTCRPRPRARAR